jgi:hypothetical protein
MISSSAHTAQIRGHVATSTSPWRIFCHWREVGWRTLALNTHLHLATTNAGGTHQSVLEWYGNQRIKTITLDKQSKHLAPSLNNDPLIVARYINAA